jgi:hypothetical protein
MSKSIFLAPLYFLRLPIKSEKYFTIDNNLNLTNNKELIRNLIKNYQSLNNIIGSIEYNNLLSGRPILYCIKNLPDLKAVEKEMHNFLIRVEFFSQTVWSLKNSAVNSETCFAILENNNRIDVHTNNFGSYYYDIKLSREEILLNNPEIEFIKNRYFLDEDYDYEIQNSKGSILEKGTPRYQRAIHHFVNARRANTYEFKIAHYCAGYESLLSSSQTELSHQLSERIAILCAKNKFDRFEVYKIAKKIYNIRSKVVHGSTVSLNNLEELTKNADDWARQIDNLIFQDESFFEIIFEKDETKIDEYFMRKIFNCD